MEEQLTLQFTITEHEAFTPEGVSHLTAAQCSLILTSEDPQHTPHTAMQQLEVDGRKDQQEVDISYLT